ncbi:MAG: hypothetical protein IAF38_13530 [Bacteroidia bacterium]|nr:hypothetical protein [Bacteroidia bacterium]
MRQIWTFLVIIISILTLGCSSKFMHEEKLITGIYCGNCPIRNCSPVLIITNECTRIDTSDDFFFGDGSKMSEPEESVRVSDSLHQQIKKLLNEVPSSFNGLDERIGCPDCIDQCGYYISNGVHSSRIDPHECEKEIEVFMQKVKKAVKLCKLEILE